LSDDQLYMEMAHRLAWRALGTTAENPPVGCVIAKSGKVTGVGWTQPGGRPHAEIEALKMAGEAARGATAYVTLEPCAHHGRTPPCAEALVKAGIARVVFAKVDPDPRVSGKGLQILKDAGIAVHQLAPQSPQEELFGFCTRILKKRPYAILKLAISSDGKIADAKGQRTAITGPEANARVHLMRAQSDAILIGLSTALIDDPDLTCRLPGLENRSPIRIVADSRLSIPPRLKLVKTANKLPLWLLSARKGHLDDAIKIIDCRPTAEGWVDFTDALKKLASLGINRLLVEGGSFIAHSLLSRDLVDEVHLFRSPMVLGPHGVEAFAGYPFTEFEKQATVVADESIGADRLLVYRRNS
jgi:diaminohydroxyphosphoribosylaminopyrimidine deaminase / 5-amino-6-(5-phosphoribosylamino)uracil reductase